MILKDFSNSSQGFGIWNPVLSVGLQHRIGAFSASVTAHNSLPVSYNKYFDSQYSIDGSASVGIDFRKLHFISSASYGTSGFSAKAGGSVDISDSIGISVESNLPNTVGTFLRLGFMRIYYLTLGANFAIRSIPGMSQYDVVMVVGRSPKHALNEAPILTTIEPKPTPSPVSPAEPDVIPSTELVAELTAHDSTLEIAEPLPSIEVEEVPTVSQEPQKPHVEEVQNKVVFEKTNLKQFDLIEKWRAFLVGHPEIELVSINFVGGKMSMNEGYNRIKKVKDFLVGAGVEEKRIKPGKMIKSKEDPYIKIDIIRIRGD